MTPEKASQLITALRIQLSEMNREYYKDSNPTLEDATYDEIARQLKELEELFPQFSSNSSATKIVGDDTTGEFEKVVHATPMLSLDNLFDEADLAAWLTRLDKDLEGEEHKIVGELKIDGLAISIIYRNGELDKVITRGDGSIGENIAANAMTISTLPHSLPNKIDIEFRGEAFFPKKKFEEYNKNRLEKGLPAYKNPRNAASGGLRMKDSSQVAMLGLSVFIYDVIGGNALPTHMENLGLIKGMGLPVTKEYRILRTKAEILDFCKDSEKARNSFDFEIDGAVLKVNSHRQRNLLGFRQKSPVWANAWKFTAERKLSRLLGVENSIGRTGALTPVANLEPVVVAGTEVRRATMHNYDFVSKLDICIGDYVFIEKGGDIIPKIISVDFTKRENENERLLPPETCPSCNTDLLHINGLTEIRCPNTECPAKLLESLKHFVSRQTMDIRGLGEGILIHLINEKMIRNACDIYALHDKAEDLKKLESMGDRLVEKLLSAIEESKTRPLSNFIHALGIPHFGRRYSQQLASLCEKTTDFMNFDRETLMRLPGFNSTIVEGYLAWISNLANRNRIDDFISMGVTPINIKSAKESLNKSVVITGNLSLKRNEWKRKLEEAGFKVIASVSSKTDYLLAGKEPGSKFAKAGKLGIKILDETEMNKLLDSFSEK